jgi:hypothetical protein
MHWPEPQRLTAAQQDPTGIQDTALTAGANIASAEIDNRDGRLTRLALVAEWINAGAATAGGLINAHLIHALDGNYEDGAAAVDPHTTPAAVFRDNAGTGRQRQAEIGIPIGPFRFKVLLVSELSQNSTVRLAAYRYATER